ncbi:MAG: hypothetical protein NC120_09470 [Ruminococcus sp.]|nr:hypothetical protein [Ruminococcus sp.]
MFDIGQSVVYAGSEICRIDSKVTRCFDGVNEQVYFRLIPEESASSSYYIPEDKLSCRVRPLLTGEEILAVIDEMPETQAKWSENRSERKEMFGKVLRSDDYRQILGVMKALYLEKEKRSTQGRKGLISSDEKVFAAAEKLMNKEFSRVLGISEKEVPVFIENRLCRK